MSKRHLKVLLLVDLISKPPQDYDYTEYLAVKEWKSEADVVNVLKKLGHEVKVFGIHNDIISLVSEIQENPPDLAFNLCEAFDGRREYEPNIIALLEMMKLKYTGAGSTALHICKDKGLTKQILSYHRIHVPRFIVFRKLKPFKSLKKFTYPAFIKPLGLEASEGIAQMSFVNNEKDALDRVRFIHDRFDVDAIVEEYIDGREIYVGILGNEKLVAFPPRELFFKSVPEGEPKIATFKAKWDKEYRSRWGIKSGLAKDIPEKTQEKMFALCKKVYHLFQMKGYGRIDLRLQPNGEFVFLEANPNPAIASDEDFALSAKQAGWSYEDLIEKLIALSGV